MKTMKIRGALGFVQGISLPRAPAQCTFDGFAPGAQRHPSPSILNRSTAAPSRDAELTRLLARRTASTLTHPSAPSEKNVHSCCKIILQFITFQNIAPTHSSPVSSVLFRPQCTRAGNSGAACARTWMIRARRHRRSGTSCNQRC